MTDFINGIFDKAKKNRKKIVLPETEDPRVTEAASKIIAEGIADLILIGDEDKIKLVTPEYSLEGAEYIDPSSYEKYDEFVKIFYEMRKKRGMTEDEASKMMLNPVYFGMMLVHQGVADGLVAGAVNSTANVLRPALQILRTKPGTKLVSAFFVMVTKTDLGSNGTVLFADCALNENPDADQLSEIAISSAQSFRDLIGEEPVVAMTSYSSFGSASSEMVDKVIEATKLAQEKAPDLLIDGEMQIDTALSPATSEQKAPGNKVGGKANVLVFPDLNTGNIGYKLVQYLGGAEAYGPVLQGIAKPVNDLSRGCSVSDIVGVVGITAVLAQMEDN
ncbi:MAG TPA: phosphate acetyltransferase [Clostridiaceae bacterium]|nr:phosphate acetyltransferase [Clostridiaceae bacterium]